MFEELLSANPSQQSRATHKAARDVVDGKVPLSTACKTYNVQEQAVIQFIIDMTEYETILDMNSKV